MESTLESTRKPGRRSPTPAGQIGRRVCAIEISPVYVDVAVQRWQTAAGKPAVLVGSGRSFEELAAERLAQAA